jgi:hypothetical protein
MDRTPTTRNEPPEQPPKTAHLQVLYGASRDRTGDLLLAKQALSQLSYGPASSILGDRSGAASTSSQARTAACERRERPAPRRAPLSQDSKPPANGLPQRGGTLGAGRRTQPLGRRPPSSPRAITTRASHADTRPAPIPAWVTPAARGRCPPTPGRRSPRTPRALPSNPLGRSPPPRGAPRTVIPDGHPRTPPGPRRTPPVSEFPQDALM